MVELGILPRFDSECHEPKLDPLRDRVTRRAAEIRRQWNEAENNSSQIVIGIQQAPEATHLATPIADHRSDKIDAVPESVRRTIGEIPTADIRAAVRNSLRTGARDRDHLLHEVKLALGFQRLRGRIKSRIIASIATEVRMGSIKRNGAKLELCEPEYADLNRCTLIGPAQLRLPRRGSCVRITPPRPSL